MKREFISAFRSEVWLLARHPATALMIALAAVLYVLRLRLRLRCVIDGRVMTVYAWRAYRFIGT